MEHFIDNLLTSVSSPVAYFLVFLVPALEASVFFGFVLPGETVAVLGGVLAAQHRASLSGMIAVAIAGAVIGDAVGYGVGHKYGKALQLTRPGRFVGAHRWRAAEDFLHRRAGPAVLLGRWTALLRALVPAAAGMAGMRYRTFATWNVIGGVVWATVVVLAGFIAGNAYHRLQQYLGRGAFVVFAIVIAGFVARHFWAKRRREQSDDAAELI